MNKFKFFLFFLAVLFGAFLFVFGEYDDSPVGMPLGVVLAIVGAVGLIKSRKKKSNAPTTR